MTSKRRSYSAKLKLEAVNFAMENNNCAAGRKYGVNEKLIRDWIKNADKIKAMPKTKLTDRSKKCLFPTLEETVAAWVEENRNNGLIITRNQIRLKAKSIARAEKLQHFTGSNSWCSRFMIRNNLVLRQKTKIAQKLPDDYEEKITNFHRFIIRQRQRFGYDLSFIGNMDETPVWFDMPGAKTVHNRGEKTILVKTTGHEKSRFTVVLACLANGVRLKPMVIFKRKTQPKRKFPAGVVAHNQPKDWMDESGSVDK